MESTQLYVDYKIILQLINQHLRHIQGYKKCRLFGKYFIYRMAQIRLYWSDFHNFIFKFIPVYCSLVTHFSTIIINSTCRTTKEIGNLSAIRNAQT